jgi:putative RNA 2'-phosphotransferase
LFSAERISRFLSFLLRHRPKEYPLLLDRHGFAPWGEVVDTIPERFQEVTEEQIRAVVTGTDKKRFELKNGKVRATYGHFFPVNLGLERGATTGTLLRSRARSRSIDFAQRAQATRSSVCSSQHIGK